MLPIPLIDKALDVFRSIPFLYNDWVDRLNFQITSVGLLLVAMFVGAKQHLGKPIQCWVPHEYYKGWEEFVEDYCFVEGTYFKPSLPAVEAENVVEEDIKYYQWVPLVLTGQAFFFYIAHFVWKKWTMLAGVSIEAVLQKSQEAVTLHGQDRRDCIAMLARYIEDCLGIQKQKALFASSCAYAFCGSAYTPLCFRQNHGYFMTMGYLLSKILALVNLVLQMMFTRQFIGHESYLWGADMVHSLYQGREWNVTGHFPRVTNCKFPRLKHGTTDEGKETVQCVLMINLFNECIYIMLWWWLMMLIGLTICNIMCWSFCTCLGRLREAYVRRYLNITLQPHDDALLLGGSVTKFVRHGLSCDGVLLLRFVSDQAGDMVACEVAHELYCSYRELVEEISAKNINLAHQGGKIGHSGDHSDGAVSDPTQAENMFIPSSAKLAWTDTVHRVRDVPTTPTDVVAPMMFSTYPTAPPQERLLNDPPSRRNSHDVLLDMQTSTPLPSPGPKSYRPPIPHKPKDL